jgi:hypothetical protein
MPAPKTRLLKHEPIDELPDHSAPPKTEPSYVDLVEVGATVR